MNVGRPEDYGNCESETQPEFIAEHGNGVPGVTVVAAVNVGHFVTGVRVGRLMIIVAHVVHLNVHLRWRIHTPAKSLYSSTSRRERDKIKPTAKHWWREKRLLSSKRASPSTMDHTGARRGTGAPDLRSMSDVAGLMRIGCISRRAHPREERFTCVRTVLQRKHRPALNSGTSPRSPPAWRELRCLSRVLIRPSQIAQPQTHFWYLI